MIGILKRILVLMEKIVRASADIPIEVQDNLVNEITDLRVKVLSQQELMAEHIREIESGVE